PTRRSSDLEDTPSRTIECERCEAVTPSSTSTSGTLMPPSSRDSASTLSSRWLPNCKPSKARWLVYSVSTSAGSSPSATRSAASSRTSSQYLSDSASKSSNALVSIQSWADEHNP